MKPEKPTKVTVICGNFDLPHYVRGTEAKCTVCSSKLWLSYDSVKQLRKRVEGLKVADINTLCMTCGLKDLEVEKSSPGVNGKDEDQLEAMTDMLRKAIRKEKTQDINKETHREL